MFIFQQSPEQTWSDFASLTQSCGLPMTDHDLFQQFSSYGTQTSYISKVFSLLQATISQAEKKMILEILLSQKAQYSQLPLCFCTAIEIFKKRLFPLHNRENIFILAIMGEKSLTVAELFEEFSRVKHAQARGLISSDFFNKISLLSRESIRKLTWLIRLLRLLNPALVTTYNVDLLLTYDITQWVQVAVSLQVLKNFRKQPKVSLTQQMLRGFVRHSHQAEMAAQIFLILQCLSPQLLNEADIVMVFDRLPQNRRVEPELFRSIWESLWRHQPEIINSQTLDVLLIQCRLWPRYNKMLELLPQEPSPLLTADMWHILGQSKNSLIDALIAIKLLQKNPRLNALPLLESLVGTSHISGIVQTMGSIFTRGVWQHITQKDMQYLIEQGSQSQSYASFAISFYTYAPENFTDETRELIIQHQPYIWLIHAFLEHSPAIMVTPVLSRLLQYPDRMGQLWQCLNRTRTPLTLEQFWQCWESPDITRYFEQQDIIAPAERQLRLNRQQNTHTASVHLSASESAARLLKRYSKKVSTEEDLSRCYRQIDNWATKLNKNSRQIVHSCTQYLRHESMVDERSQVSLRQLIALGWVASSDHRQRLSDYPTAKKRFFEGIDDMHYSDGRGKKICSGGMFNKGVEMLVAVHPDAEQLVITKEQASSKFHIVVQEEVNAAFQILGPEEQSLYSHQLEEEGSAEPLWDHVKNQVASRILDEFGSLYPGLRENEAFQSLMSFGPIVPIDAASLKSMMALASRSSALVIFSNTHPDTQTSANSPVISREP